MTLRFEIFPDDLDVIVDFYTRVLLFRLTADQRSEPSPYVALQRDDVRIGAARRAGPDARTARMPPAGVELVLEVDDVLLSAIGLSRRDGRSRRICKTVRGA
jgi:predicted enzyme related to lactoylglutathione lyase